MKQLLRLLILCISTTFNAQIVNIPDADFKEILIDASASNQIAKDLSGVFTAIDVNNDGEIQVTEALNISYLNIPNCCVEESFSGIEAFINLIEFRTVDVRQVSLLDLHQNINLEILHLQDFWDLTTLDISGCVNLQSLYIDYSWDLPSLDVTQNTNLESITLKETTSITNLDVSQNSNLETLHLVNNDIVNLDISQNINLVSLYVKDTDITSLDVTQNVNLENLEIYDNGIINALDVSQNLLLKNLTSLWSNFPSLDLSQNVLLETVSVVDNNYITSLDFSQNINLQEVTAVGCYTLDTMTIKNGTSEQLDFGFGTSLSVLCADEEDMPYLQTITVLQNGTEITSYCDFFPGGHNNSISGEVRFDSDNDGCDVSDLPILNSVRIDLSGSQEGSAFAQGSGVYTFFTQDGDFTLTPHIENEDWYTITPTSVDVEFLDNNDNEFIQDFCIKANGIHSDVEIIINPIISANPGFDAVYQIVYRNKGNQVVSGDVNFMFDDDVLDFTFASISPDNQSVGNLIWNYSDLRPLESKSISVTLNVNSPMESPAVNIGDQLDFSASITPVSNDETPVDNEFNFKDVVVGSFDPNDITCLEGDIVAPEMIGEYLHYNVRFENTGTGAATFVVVTNDIDETIYDLSSFQIMHSSHDMMTRITDNKVEFIFDDINLEPEGMGNVVFKIKSRGNLTIGDSVSQQANIYFDFNYPIETNVATTTFEALSVSEFLQDNAVSVYPNPTDGQLFIKSLYPIEHIELYDIQGRKVQEFTISDDQIINISNTSKGVYFFKIRTELGTSVQKIIKD